MKKLSFRPRNKVSLKTKIAILIFIILCLFSLSWIIFVQVSEWYDVNRFQFDKPIEIILNNPIKVVKRKPQIIEKITKEIITVEDDSFIFVRISHYWPPLGGTNCLNYKNGECVSRMANGDRY